VEKNIATDSRISTDDYFRLIRLPVLAASNLWQKNIATDSRIGTDDYFRLIRLPVLAASNLWQKKYRHGFTDWHG
jgi:hypothetical protein